MDVNSKLMLWLLSSAQLRHHWHNSTCEQRKAIAILGQSTEDRWCGVIHGGANVPVETMTTLHPAVGPFIDIEC
jgi:hypothetical protein